MQNTTNSRYQDILIAYIMLLSKNRRGYEKRKSNINPSRRKFLTGSATVAGVAAASALVPIKVSYANHTASDAKGLPGFIKWKKDLH